VAAAVVRETVGATREGAVGLAVAGLSHRFGRRPVVAGVDLTVPRGAIHCLVGPSGCGKSTTLRLIAGLETVQSGTIRIGGRLVADPGVAVPPERRRVGLMFQDFALFPHLTVAENVAFGLTGRGRARRRARVASLLERVAMTAYAGTYPHTLSGGEQQRVALARALAPEPDLLLLDEAFSALDATLRAAVREDTLAVLRETGTPTLLVTHDAEEAIGAGDVIHVMRRGRIVQAGTPAELWRRPVDAFVAGFFGGVQRFTGRVTDGRVRTPLGAVGAGTLRDGDEAEVVVRPEGVVLRAAGGPEGVPVTVVGRRDLGPVHTLTLALADGRTVVVRREGLAPVPVGPAAVALDPAHVFVFPAAGG
jgi:iron(III) transport system ATP-binding protein